MKRRLTTVTTVAAASIAFGWALTRQSGTPTFSLPPSSNSSGPLVSEARNSAPSNKVGRLNWKAYKSWPGPYRVSEIPEVVLSDAKRGSDLRVRVFYPAGDDRFPVILISPEDSGSEACCDAMTRHWASHGYVVLELIPDSSAPRNSPSWKVVDLKRKVHEAVKAPETSEKRVLDMSFIIDSLPDLQKRFVEIRGKIDLDHIGAAGQGKTAAAMEALAGATLGLPGRPRANLADPRVRAVLCISPQNSGAPCLTAHSLDEVILPYLGIASSLDGVAVKFASAGQEMALARSQPGDKYELVVHGADEGSATVRTAADPPSTEKGPQSAAEFAKAAALAFWDAYLKHDPVAKRYLQSDTLEKISKGAVQIERR